MHPSLGSALIGGTGAGLAAAVANSLVFATGAIDGSVETPAGGPISIGAVIAFSIIPNIIGGAAFWALYGRVSRPLRTWQIVVAVGTVLSFVTVLGLESAPTAMVVALVTMHVVAGAAALLRPASEDLFR